MAVTNTTPNPARLLSASPPNGPGARALGAVTASGATDARAPAPPPRRGPPGDLHARRPSEYEPARDVPSPSAHGFWLRPSSDGPGHGPRASVSCYAPPHCPRSPRPRRATLPAGGRPTATHSLPALCSGDFSDSQMTATRSMFSSNIAVPEAFAPHPRKTLPSSMVLEPVPCSARPRITLSRPDPGRLLSLAVGEPTAPTSPRWAPDGRQVLRGCTHSPWVLDAGLSVSNEHLLNELQRLGREKTEVSKNSNK